MSEGNAAVTIPATSGVAIARNLFVKLDTTNTNATQVSVDLAGAGEQTFGITDQTTTEANKDVGVVIVPDYEALIDYAKKQGTTFEEEININVLTEDAKEEIVETFRMLLESGVKDQMGKLAVYQRVTRIGIERDEFTKTSTRKIKRFLYNGRLDIVDIE